MKLELSQQILEKYSNITFREKSLQLERSYKENVDIYSLLH